MNWIDIAIAILEIVLFILKLIRDGAGAVVRRLEATKQNLFERRLK